MIEIMRYSLIFLLLISTVIITASEQIIIEMDPKEYTGSSAIDLGAARKELSQGKVRNDPALQKLSTDLFQLLHPEKLPELIDPELHVQAMADHGQLRFLEGRTSLPGSAVHVYIYLKNGYNIMAVEQLCHEVTNRKLDYFYLSAWVKVRDLVALASLEEVRTIRTVMPPVYYTGTVTTQGDTLHKTAQVREDYNQGGSQIRVGVITDGVTHRSQAQATGDLPPDGQGLTVLSDALGGDEGTALLEIIYDMTPDVLLYFHDSGTSTGAFIDAIDELLANNCLIICDDVGWILEPFFEDGSVADHIAGILSSREEVAFVSAAGNAGQTHNQSFFTPTVSDPNFHDFSEGTTQTPYLYLNMQSGSSVRIVLQWNDPFGGSGNDYDLYLYSVAAGNFVAASTYSQNGDDDPLEFLWYQENGTYAGDFFIMAYRYSGEPRLLEVFIYPVGNMGVYSNNISPVDAIFGHPAVPGVVATGAVHPDNINVIAPYSSQGPSTKFNYSARDQRTFSEIVKSPLAVGTAGVFITGAGGFGQPGPGGTTLFYGTSASAPHLTALIGQGL